MTKTVAPRLALFFATAFLSTSLSFAQLSTGAVASVNGQPIDAAEYYHRMEFLSGVGTVINSRYVELPPGFLTLNTLISEKLLLQLATQHGVSPTDAQVDQRYRAALAQNPNMEKDWVAGGRTVDELKYQYRISQAQFNLETEGVVVTDQEIDSEYATNKDRYTVPKLVHLRVIVVDSEDSKKAVDADLTAGKAFSDVARARSMDITKAEGGDFGSIPETSLPDYLDKAVQTIKIGQTSDWIPGADKQAGLWLKIYFQDATPAKVMPLDDALRQQIRTKLMLDRGSVKNNLVQEMKDMRLKASIQIQNPDFQTDFQNLVDNEKKAAPANAGGKTSGS